MERLYLSPDQGQRIVGLRQCPWKWRTPKLLMSQHTRHRRRYQHPRYLDTGTTYQNPRPLKRYEQKFARAQRKLSRQVFLSQNWYKQKRKVERLHYRIACIRTDAHHKATTDIVRKAGETIGIETLSGTNLRKNHKLAKAVPDSALGGFLEKLKTKAQARGIPIVQADRFFASSKTFSTCGHQKTDFTRSDRTYPCQHCGVSIDRDVNAAIN